MSMLNLTSSFLPSIADGGGSSLIYLFESKATILHCFSSLTSLQSGFLSHLLPRGMQVPSLQVNWSDSQLLSCSTKGTVSPCAQTYSPTDQRFFPKGRQFESNSFIVFCPKKSCCIFHILSSLSYSFIHPVIPMNVPYLSEESLACSTREKTVSTGEACKD